ncbi:Hypothetical protein PENO1_065820 [Penicillium occitanis (nom. inval.)]|nr:Hypothetical protein PENO1_065820 [Penicillium occitanis (nom. inval.)]PCH06650.1 hypothetical protein PENOC_022860 [Penicillium occitanis (nom. inval.)]
MKSIIALSAMAGLVSVALTAPSRLHLRSGNTQEVNVMIQQIKSTSETDIAVVSQDTSEIIGYSCSSTLNSGAFADLPITADIDENGAGTLTVGSTTYKVHEDRDTSGGIACARIFNDGESFLDCAVPVPSSLNLSPLGDQETTCFNSGAIPGLQSAYKSMLAQQGPPEPANLTRRDLSLSRPVLDERQCGIWSASSQVVGDGNPHQNYYLKQLSENINCGAADSCSVGQTESVSYTIGWTASATAEEWLTGGFAVSASWTTGNTYSCNGGSGDTICVWYNTAHTAYTCENGEFNACTGFSGDGDNFVMYSPNSNNVGGGYYCVVGTCRSQGEGYWNYDGPAGGPQD